MNYSNLLKRHGYAKQVLDNGNVQYVKTHLQNQAIIRISKDKRKVKDVYLLVNPLEKADRKYGIEAQVDFNYLNKEGNMLVADIKEMLEL